MFVEIRRSGVGAETDTDTVVALPGVGESPQYFRPLAESVRVPIVGWLYPGRHDRIDDVHPRSVLGLSRELTSAIVDRGSRGRIFLLGHSMGCLVAIHTAVSLQALGLPVDGLILCACPEFVSRDGRAAKSVDPLEFLKQMHGSVPEVFQYDEFRELMLPTIAADLAALQERVPIGPPMQSPTLFLIGREDSHADASAADTWSGQFPARDIMTIDGGHFFPTDSPAQVGECISTFADRRM